MKRALLIVLALLLVTAIGAVFQSRVTPFVGIAAVGLVLALVASNRLADRWLPIYIYGLSLSLLWATSMMGTYVVGTDIHAELYVIKSSMATGWNPDWVNGNNTSAVIGIIAPALGKIGFDPVWQLKALYPAIFAITPVLLYLIYKRYFDYKTAFYATVFIIIMPMFVLDMTSMAKSMVAETAMVGALYVVITRRNIVFALLLVGLAVISHYTIAFLMAGYLVSATTVLLIVKRDWHILSRVAGLSVAVVLITALWFGTVGQGAMLNEVVAIAKNLTRVTTTTIVNPAVPSVAQANITDHYEEYTQAQPNQTSYLGKQEQLVRTALGIDFMDADALGKVFRVLQYLTEVLIVIGLGVFLWVKRREFGLYEALIVSSGLLLLACLFIPFFTTVVSTTRLYQIALFFIAPMLVVGASAVFRNRQAIVPILLAYGLFTTGVVFEVSQSRKLDTVNLPYSVALSNWRTGISGAFNADDRALAEWISKQTIPMNVFVDYNSSTLLIGYDMTHGRFTSGTPIQKGDYVLLNSWNTTHGEMVYGSSPGLRSYAPIPTMTDVTLVAWSGKAGLYRVNR